MKPIEIILDRPVHEIFRKRVLPHLEDKNIAFLVQQTFLPPHARIVLSPYAEDMSDIQPILVLFRRVGIQRKHIQIISAGPSGREILQSALARGLKESGLGFGRDVAEKDAGLARYFVKTPSFVAVKSGERHIVVGPKGSGKSAILRKLVEFDKSALVITPEHYATDMLKSVVSVQIGAEVSAFVTTWKYSLLIEVFRRIVQNQIGDSKAIARIRRYLSDHGHQSPETTLFERFIAYLRRISQIKGKIGPAEVGVEVGAEDDLGKLFKMGELLELMPALKSILRKSSFTVYIDELDQSWDNSDTANKFLVSLLTAAIQLRGLDDNLHVVVCLRSEIFDLLKPHLSQLDKLRSDIQTLNWNRSELTSLIVSRALDSLKITDEDSKNLLAQSAVNSLFSDNTQSRNQDLFGDLLARTSYRPREVIQFCNLALEKAIALNHRSLTWESVSRAEEEFSAWKVEHIISENREIHPGLDELLERLRGQPRQMDIRTIDSLLAEIILENQERESSPEWLMNCTEPHDLLKLLYSLEVLGIENVGGRRSDPHRPWEAYDFAYTRPKGKPERSDSFLFHPGLWKALELL